jgi:hypothetical protein
VASWGKKEEVSARYFRAFNIDGPTTGNGVVVNGNAGALLGRVTVNSPVASGSVTIYDANTNSVAPSASQLLAKLTWGTTTPAPFTVFYDAQVNAGILVQAVGTGIDVTISHA